MPVLNPQRFAKKISESISQGKLVNQGVIAREIGYSLQTSQAPQRITETKAYKEAMERYKKPLLERLDENINKTELALSKKNLTKEDARTLTGMLDVFIKNKHLLSGGLTSLNVFVLPSEVMQRNDITANNKDDGQG